jgi:type II secretory pathway pseudopilin PulG
LNQELRATAARHKKAARDLAAAGEEVEAYSVPQAYPQVRTTYRYRVPYTTMRNENAKEKKERETQLAAAKQRQQQAQSALDQTKQQMTDTRSQREQADADYKQATADKRQQLLDARRKSRDLADRAKDIEQFTHTPEKIKSRVTELGTYVPLDTDTEKSRLLATFKSAG